MNIKKTALALGSALMLFANTLSAQEQPWSFGVKTGSSMSWLQGSEKLISKSLYGTDKYDFKTSGELGYSGGLTAGYAFHQNLGVGLEVLYIRLGGTVKVTEKSSNGSTNSNKPVIFRAHTDNIAIPLMLKWFPMGCNPEEGILTVDLGVQGIMPLRTKLDSKDENDKDAKFEAIKTTGGKDLNKKEVFNSLNLDGIVGVSYEFPRIGLTLGGRYHLGAMNALKGGPKAKDYRVKSLGIEKDAKVRSHYVTLSLGYNFARLLSN